MRKRMGYLQCLPVAMVCLHLSNAGFSQTFSDDPEVFKTEAVGYLRQMGTEAANKVAYDFDNAWNSLFQTAHKQKMMGLAQGMKRKGYSFNPHFWHFFSYLAYSAAQERINAQTLTNILEINEESLRQLGYEEYADFLLGLNVFFAGRYLQLSRNLSVQVPGGTYKFMNIEPSAAAETESGQEERPPAVLPPATGESAAQDNWGDDDWGSDDDWGNDDGWGSDTWLSDPVEEAPQIPQRVALMPAYQDHVALEKSNYRHPVIEGPVIQLNDVQVLFVTKSDSLAIRKVSGSQMLKNETFVAESGVLEWPGENRRVRGAEVTLGEFHFKVNRPIFKTPNATLTFPSLLNKKTEGVFYYKSVRRPPRALSSFPRFQSYEPDLRIDFANGRVVYNGGIEIRGNDLFGSSVSRKRGTLEITNDAGHKVMVRAQRFHFRADSVITSPNAGLTILLNADSVYHPSVEMWYDIKGNKLTALREKTHDVTPFLSTYHGMDINADLIRWQLASDSISITIMNGKDLVPATFESDDYFSVSRFRRLAGPFGFHPIALAVNYANKYNIKAFVVDELAQEYNVALPLAKGAVKMLAQYNFCAYDPESGLVQLYDKAFHYYESSAKRKDYDNLFIPSVITRRPNATLHLDSADMVVRGVEKFYATTDFGVTIEPEEETIKIGENRTLTYNGAVDVGGFLYKGKDYEFNYEGFLINMPVLDSIRIQLAPSDTTLNERNPENKESLKNHLTGTSGVLYLNRPDNKSGIIAAEDYPYFVTDSEAIVYFDGKEILDGAYDRSVFFILPPFELDSINAENAAAIKFPGTFNSGGIFPTFEDTLSVREDKSLGFVHNIPEEGYNLYGTEAKTYEQISLSNEGIRGGGEIDFLTSRIFSEDFIYYPDSVTADGYKGNINPGNLNGASYPQADMGRFRMYWLPRKDSMYLRTVDEPFLFYEATAELTGEANITTKGVFGSGEILTRGSRAVSDDYTFKELSYNARHAKFEVLTNDPEKPAMSGDDIGINFDLVKNQADIRPEKVGEASLSFPYAALKTSMTNAVWYLEDSVVTMAKPETTDLQDSYFYSTREELDSLAFNAEKGSYDINTQEMEVAGIPYIAVRDARITPENNQMTVLANSVLQTFQNAEVVFQNDSTYHYLFDGTIDIASSKDFFGGATYLLPIGKDTFNIKFRAFGKAELPLGKDRTAAYTVAEGDVTESENMAIAPGFLYKGAVTLKAYKQSLDLDGLVKPVINSIPDNEWLKFSRVGSDTDVILDFDNALNEDDLKVSAGLHFDLRGNLYPSFVEKKIAPEDKDFFVAAGLLKHEGGGRFIIEDRAKSARQSYAGQTLTYDDSTTSMTFEGKARFLDAAANQLKLEAAVIGSGVRDTADFNLNSFFTFDYRLSPEIPDLMAADLLDVVERLGNPPANNIESELLTKLANIAGDAAAKKYEKESLKGYVPMVNFSEQLNKSVVVSGVKMKWNKTHRAWHNTTKLGISNILKEDVNAKMDGFLEIKKNDIGGDAVNLFLQAAPGTWYFFGYDDNSLIIYSSNPDFNAALSEKTNEDKLKVGNLTILLAEENEVLMFINEFREQYFGITEPYDLVYPTEINLEEESFDTIEEDEDEDDGFGF